MARWRGAGIDLLGAARLPGVEVAGRDGSDTTSDQGVVTAGAAAEPGGFASQFVDAISAHRHWGRVKGPVPA